MNKNKQELINELKRISLEKQHKALTHPESKNYYEGMVMAYSQVVHMVNTVLKLDESQKPVMPKFFDDWAKRVIAERDKFYAISLIARAGWGYGVDYELGKSENSSTTRELLDWLVEDSLYLNKEKAINALLYGYEVEKEPLYYVKLPVVYFNHLDLETYLMKDDRGNITIADNNDFDDMKFTESEIKAIDERYWPFAVPVIEGLEQEE